MAEITQILQRISAGDRLASDELAPLVYQQLRQIAQRQLSDKRDGRQWDATELVHEAYIRLIGDAKIAWQDRAHFFATAATAIRRVLVDSARKARAQKRGGAGNRVDVTLSGFGKEDLGFGLVELDEALRRLQELSDRRARLVELRFAEGRELASLDLGVGFLWRSSLVDEDRLLCFVGEDQELGMLTILH